MTIDDDVKACEQIIKSFMDYQALTTDEKFAIMKSESFPKLDTLPYPRGDGLNEILVGSECFDYLTAMASRWFSDLPDKADRDAENFVDQVRKFFLPFLNEFNADLPRLVEQLRQRAIEEEAASHSALIHHFPCVFVDAEEPAVVTIGPARLVRLDVFTNTNKVKIDKARSFSKLAERLVDGFDDFSKSYNWVISISVPACAESVSRRRAALCARLFFASVRAVWAHARSSKIGFAIQSPRDSLRPYSLSEDASNSVLHYRSSMFWADLTVKNGWLVDESDLHPLIPLLESALNYQPQEFELRLIDALLWFEQAVWEDLPGPKIVKLVAALERLTSVKQNKTLREAAVDFLDRVSFFAATKVRDKDESRCQADSLKKARNKLLHGSKGVDDQDLIETARLGVDLTGDYISSMLKLLDRGKRSNAVMTDSELERILSRSS